MRLAHHRSGGSLRGMFKPLRAGAIAGYGNRLLTLARMAARKHARRAFFNNLLGCADHCREKRHG